LLFRKIINIIFFSGLFVLFFPGDLWGRAGGGGGFGGSGGGGFGGGGGGDGVGGIVIYWLIMHPAIGIPVAIVAIIFMIFARSEGVNAYKGRTIRKGKSAVCSLRESMVMAQVNVKDDTFDSEQFKQRIAHGFTMIQAAWCKQNLDKVRPFISDGIFERFSIQFEEQKMMGWRGHMVDVVVHNVHLESFHSDNHFDVLTVSVSASAIDYRVSLKTNKFISGDRTKQHFVEFWSFIRQPGVKTADSTTGLIEGNCPNCGTAIAMNMSAKCESCDAHLRGGQYDWVLSEITQASEWKANQAPINGLKGVNAKGNNINRQHLEDRCSVMFWRKVFTDLKGDLSYITKMANDSFISTYRVRYKNSFDKKNRRFIGNCAVGGVDTLGVLHDSGNDWVYALVKVRWSGDLISAKKGLFKKSGDKYIHQSGYLLGKKSGASVSGHNVSSAHCSNCGAAENGGTSNACEYCGVVMNDGASDWVLCDILSLSGPQSKRFMGDAHTAQAAFFTEAVSVPPAEILHWSIKMGLADGVLDKKEMLMLEALAVKMEISSSALATIIHNIKSNTEAILEPKDYVEALFWLNTLADIVLADGRISKREFVMLCAIGKRFKYTQYDIKKILKQRKNILYKSSRQALKASRKRSN